MKHRNQQDALKDPIRRNFLQAVSAGAPTLALILKNSAQGAGRLDGSSAETYSAKFTPVDLSRFFTAAPADFGPRPRAKAMGVDSSEDGLIRMPTGKQALQGIPFWLGPEGVGRKSWIVLSTRPSSWARHSLDIPLQGKAGFVCLAAFCDWDENETPPPDKDVTEKLGQLLGNAVLVCQAGGEYAFPIRRRFEVNSPTVPWGHLSFASQPHREDAPRKLTDPLSNGLDWGELQTCVRETAYAPGPLGTLWVCALPNPQPERDLKLLRLQAESDDPLMICGATLFHGNVNPLRHERLCLYRFTLPETAAAENGRWKVDTDLGVVVRTFVLGEFEPDAWLPAPDAGLGEHKKPILAGRYLYSEVTANPAATLVLSDTMSGRRYEFDLSRLAAGKELEAQPSGVRIEILEPEKVWLHGQVVDTATGHTTPARLAFRSKEGRYIPPYGHRGEINDHLFQDYGADARLTDSNFCYVDGTFQVELPLGAVFVEITKGFEYEAMRRKLTIERGQRELKLEISRFVDFRSKGWVTGDTHVHFLSPSTAILEGKAEGVNLINLLATQWGDLFANVGDLFQGPLTSRDGETLVCLGTENRQHILGHISLLGGRGAPVYPMCASGPGESSLGDPLWSSLAEWADECRKREGMVVAPHFPYPTGEIAADIVLGKIDAVEYPTQFRRTLQCVEYPRLVSLFELRLPFARSGRD